MINTIATHANPFACHFFTFFMPSPFKKRWRYIACNDTKFKLKNNSK